MLDTGGAGIEALKGGFADAFPAESADRAFPELELGGATDSGLLRLIFDAYDLPWSSDREESFYLCYLQRLKPALEHSFASKAGRRMPGIDEIIDSLGRAGHYSGLLTGNIDRAARLKLQSFDFDHQLFPFGAFGDDHHDRNRLGPIALDRAERMHGRSFDPAEEVFILGDTVKDIKCARAFGARVIAVATGACDYRTLAAAEPDYLFESLEDYQLVSRETGLG